MHCPLSRCADFVQAAIAKLAAGRAQISGGYFRCGPKSGVYDAFEPTLVRQALIDHPYLGALVFGHKAWSLLRPPVTGNAATATTAALQLQEYFFPGLNTGIVYLAPHTWLDVTHFLTDGLFIAQVSRLLRKCSVPVHLLHIDGSTDVWSVHSAKPNKFVPSHATTYVSTLTIYVADGATGTMQIHWRQLCQKYSRRRPKCARASCWTTL